MVLEVPAEATLVVVGLAKLKNPEDPDAGAEPAVCPNNDGWAALEAAGVPAGVVDIDPNDGLAAAGVADPAAEPNNPVPAGFSCDSPSFFSAGFPNVNPVEGAGFAAPPNNPPPEEVTDPNSDGVGAVDVVAVD